MTTDRSVGKGLLNCEKQADKERSAASAVDSARIISRTKNSVRIWAGVAILLWVLVALGFASYSLCIRTYIFPKLYETLDQYEQMDQKQILDQAVTIVHGMTFLAQIYWISLAILLALASLFTCVFIVVSRRATLRQIQASLADLSEQLKQLTAVPAG